MLEQQSPTGEVGWWLSDGNRSTGPHGESSLFAGIKRGQISPLAYACPVGGQEWRMVCEWSAFARACAAVGTVVQSNQVVTTQAPIAGGGFAGGGFAGRGGMMAHQESWSGFALTSLIVAVVGFCSHFVMAIMAAVGVSNGAKGPEPIMVCAGLMLLATLAANFVGAIFGLIGLTQPVGHKWMGLIGLLGNLLQILAIVGLFILGSVAG
jgi:hypothetical protein